jgi:hypothetical protein
MAFNHQVKLKNICKLCFDIKLHFTYVIGQCLYQFGVSQDRILYGGLPENDHHVSKRVGVAN